MLTELRPRCLPADEYQHLIAGLFTLAKWLELVEGVHVNPIRNRQTVRVRELTDWPASKSGIVEDAQAAFARIDVIRNQEK